MAANGGGSILDILSALSWVAFPTVGAYCAAKSAEWSMTNALRIQLAEQNIRVAGLHVGYMDTDMASSVTAPKSNPADIATIAIDGIEQDLYEIVADDVSGHVQSGLAGGVAALYPQLP
jgi:NAD(P)-dependent dehydrogenase (short-subunit alcohol dehydrogenase family)